MGAGVAVDVGDGVGERDGRDIAVGLGAGVSVGVGAKASTLGVVPVGEVAVEVGASISPARQATSPNTI